MYVPFEVFGDIADDERERAIHDTYTNFLMQLMGKSSIIGTLRILVLPLNYLLFNGLFRNLKQIS